MSIVVACTCGQRFKARPELVGKQVKCPACGSTLSIPMQERRSSAQSFDTACRCGAKFKAPAHLIGKSVNCPTCHQPFVVRQRPIESDPLLGDPMSAATYDPLSTSTSSRPMSRSLPVRARPSSKPDMKKIYVLCGIFGGGALFIVVAVAICMMVLGEGDDPIPIVASEGASVASAPMSGASDPASGASDPTSGASNRVSVATDPMSGARNPMSGASSATSGTSNSPSGASDTASQDGGGGQAGPNRQAILHSFTPPSGKYRAAFPKDVDVKRSGIGTPRFSLVELEHADGRLFIDRSHIRLNVKVSKNPLPSASESMSREELYAELVSGVARQTPRCDVSDATFKGIPCKRLERREHAAVQVVTYVVVRNEDVFLIYWTVDGSMAGRISSRIEEIVAAFLNSFEFIDTE